MVSVMVPLNRCVVAMVNVLYHESGRGVHRFRWKSGVARCSLIHNFKGLLSTHPLLERVMSLPPHRDSLLRQ